MRLGAHMGTSKGLSRAVETGHAIGCEVIQIFSKSPQMWKGAPIDGEVVSEFRDALRRFAIRTTAVHHSYLLNLASPKESLLKRSREAFVEEIGRAEKLGVDQLIFHPGAHTGTSEAEGLRSIAESLDWAAERTPEAKVRLLLENAAGQGTTLCRSFEELADVLGRVAEKRRFGVTLDTCHLFAAGYDFRTDESYGRMIDDLDRILGLRWVRAFHLNDSKAGLGSHLDRHENIGKGMIGAAGFRPLVNDARWAETPGYLETPVDDDGYSAYAKDLRVLRGLTGRRPRSRRRAEGG